MPHIALQDTSVTDLEEIEEAIADRLSSLQQDGVKILNIPNGARNQIAYKAAVLIYFAGSSSEEGAGGQETESLRFAINVQLEDARTHKGAYSLVRKIKTLLKGFSPTVGSKYRVGFLKPVSVDYVALKDGDWVYTMAFSLIMTHPCNHGHKGVRDRITAVSR